MAEEFSIRQIIHEVIADLETIDVEKIAEGVDARVSPRHVREALAQVLPLMVADVLHQYRPRGAVAVPTHPVKGGAVHPTQWTGSRKGNEIRGAWQRTLEAPYATESGSKRLGDCTYEDLYYIAFKLDKLAEDNQRRARGLREVAHLLTEHDAKIVRKLPAGVLMQAIG